MRSVLMMGLFCGLLAGCSADRTASPFKQAVAPVQAGQPSTGGVSTASRRHSEIARLPDRGDLLAYGAQRPIRKGAHTWHAIGLSEEHALRAIGKDMTVTAPSGRPIRLQYQRHFEHPDGNWTWVGRAGDAHPGGEAVITFGERAVFGEIPNGKDGPLQITMAGGRSWLVETDRTRHQDPRGIEEVAGEPDFITAPLASASTPTATSSRKAGTVGAVPMAGAEAAAIGTTVDLVVGYTSGFAERLGGQSQAVTRLTFLVDVANQTYANSNVEATLRLVRTVQVNYPDATANRSALFELTGVECTTVVGGQLPDGGVSCTSVGQPAALQPLIAAREAAHADVVSLVRKLEFPENGSCGLGWMIGGGQTTYSAASSDFAMSVISDSGGAMFPDEGNTCRHETLVHEIGHNMGLQHDRAIARGSDDTNDDGNLLDPEEFGVHPYSFGYSTGDGGFYTVMAPRRANQTGYRVFSNPRITSCGGVPCGVADQEDNARTLAVTIPILASFRAAQFGARSDFDADGRSDILWRNDTTGTNVVWKGGDSSNQQAITSVANLSWKVAGSGDFDGDGTSDILWRNDSTGGNVIWKAGSASDQQAVANTSLGWRVAGIADFNGDTRADILWRNMSTGANVIWQSGSAATGQFVTTVASQAWKVAGTGDFNSDGEADILWRNESTGDNVIWYSASASSQQVITGVSNVDWKIAGTGDFNGDGISDVLWRNDGSGKNTIWLSANSATQQAVSNTNLGWRVANVGDYDGDGVSDILWRNTSTGANVIWKSGNSATGQYVTSVSSQSWKIVG